GVGGDELFAGYRKHAGYRLSRKYRRLPELLRTRIVEPLALAMPAMRGTPVKGYVRLAKKMARSASLGPREYFLTNSTYLDASQRGALYSDETREHVEGVFGGAGVVDPSWAAHLASFDEVAHADFLNQMLYVDARAFMVSLNLTYNDKMSMAASAEVRVPFLDWELAQWTAANIPPGLKLRDNTGKYILREAMAPLLPAEVLTQK